MRNSFARHLVLYVMVAGVSIVAFQGAAQAVTILPGLYILNNHPDAVIDPPPYGLRLDELYDVTPNANGVDHFTFDFDDPQSDMRLIYDDINQTITIFGQAYGGRDFGNSYVNDVYLGVYEINFVYDMNVGLVPGDDDIWSTGPNHANTGTIETPLGDTFTLSDVQATNYTFRFGDEDDDLGHRGHNGISGWGWLAVDGERLSRGQDDWIFTAKYVPEPSAIAFVGFGLVVMTAQRLRRR